MKWEENSMGNFTPYSDEWERQHIQKQMDVIREKQKNDPLTLRLLVKAHSRIRFLEDLVVVHVKMLYTGKTKEDLLKERARKMLSRMVNKK